MAANVKVTNLLAGLRRVRKLNEVLAKTRERRKGRLLKSQEEVMALLRKG